MGTYSQKQAGGLLCLLRNLQNALKALVKDKEDVNSWWVILIGNNGLTRQECTSSSPNTVRTKKLSSTEQLVGFLINGYLFAKTGWWFVMLTKKLTKHFNSFGQRQRRREFLASDPCWNDGVTRQECTSSSPSTVNTKKLSLTKQPVGFLINVYVVFAKTGWWFVMPTKKLTKRFKSFGYKVKRRREFLVSDPYWKWRCHSPAMHIFLTKYSKNYETFFDKTACFGFLSVGTYSQKQASGLLCLLRNLQNTLKALVKDKEDVNFWQVILVGIMVSLARNAHPPHQVQ